jgi:hypothetical protein
MEPAAAVISAVVAAAVAIGALSGWYQKRREERLRHSDVLAWALKVIASLQSITLACRSEKIHLSRQQVTEIMRREMVQTSILVEQGRLFFKNVPRGDYGKDKPEAYQGLRPLLLDQLVLGHKIACEWLSVDAPDCQRLGLLAERAERTFVSMIRKEVGRERTATDGAALEGYGVRLKLQMQQITAQELHDGGWA